MVSHPGSREDQPRNGGMSRLAGKGWEGTVWAKSESETLEGLVKVWTGDKEEREEGPE